MKKIRKVEVISNNLKIFGFRYVLLDIFYHFFNFLYDKTVRKDFNREEDIIIKKINNYHMAIDKNSGGIHRDLYLKSVREPLSTKIMRSLLKKGDVVLDAGANIGYYVLLESKEVGEKGLVYAIEPVRENFNFLKKNVKLNKLGNVKLYDNLAFSDKIGKLKININWEGNKNTPIKIRIIDINFCKKIREVIFSFMNLEWK